MVAGMSQSRPPLPVSGYDAFLAKVKERVWLRCLRRFRPRTRLPAALAVVDPLGRTVHLTAERWEHVIRRHPYMGVFQAEVLQAIVAPTEIVRGPRPGQDWYYLRDAGPSRWLKVVVAFDEESAGSIRTAFPRRSKP
jgi:hypothetical protein